MSDKVTLPANVTMAPIESSHHSGAGYDPQAQQLYINFAKPGAPAKIYRYDNVPPDMWATYQASPSKGGYIIHQIKPFPDKFPFHKVENAGSEP